MNFQQGINIFFRQELIWNWQKSGMLILKHKMSFQSKSLELLIISPNISFYPKHKALRSWFVKMLNWESQMKEKLSSYKMELLFNVDDLKCPIILSLCKSLLLVSVSSTLAVNLLSIQTIFIFKFRQRILWCSSDWVLRL